MFPPLPSTLPPAPAIAVTPITLNYSYFQLIDFQGKSRGDGVYRGWGGLLDFTPKKPESLTVYTSIFPQKRFFLN